MKKFLLTLIFPFSFFLIPALAQQAPQKFNYQAVARDADGKALTDSEVMLRIAIMGGNDLDRPVYAEEHTVTTNKLGLFNLAIGAGEVLEGEFSSIDWGADSHYLSVEMDAEGYGNFQQMGTSQLLSVPYALYAERSGSGADGGSRNDPNDWTINGNTGTDDATNFIGTTDSQDLVLRSNNAEVARFTTDSALQMTSGGRILFGTYNAVNMDGERNIHIGERAGEVSSGDQNAFIGYNAGQVNSTGSKNTFIGPTAGRVNTTGYQNSFVGGRAGFNNTSGSQNSFIGWQAGRDNTTGTQNTFIGKYAGLSNTTGSSNTYIGKDADGSPTLSNATAIGAGATVTQSNSVVLGNNANVGVGTSAPSAKLHLVGDLRLVDGTESYGYVLTSDDSGNASWMAASSLAVTSVFDTLNGVVIPSGAVDETSDDFVFGSTQLDDDGNADHDYRFFFDKDLGAFRAGRTYSTDWDADNRGQYSFAAGVNTIASGEASVAIGDGSDATGWSAVSLGFGATASGTASVALGETPTASGLYSVAMGFGSQASGSNSTAIGEHSNATGGNSTAFAQGTASGNYAMAIGFGSTASSAGSVALGTSAESSGAYSMALGNWVEASGGSSTAMGYFTEATGSYSTAMGNNTKAPSSYETSIGRYTTNYTPNSTTGWNTSDRLFTIGNGTANNSRSDAMVVLKSGEIGIGISTPDTTLHVVGQIKYDDGNQADGYVLTSDSAGNASWTAASSLAVTTVFDTLGGVVIPGSAVDETSDDFVFGSTQLDDDGNSSHDRRFFFDKSRGAFRAGEATDGSWDVDSIGSVSFAIGYDTKASEAYSAAFGFETTASGNTAIAMGYGSIASGSISTAMGVNTTASGGRSTAMGNSTTASGSRSTAMGDNTTASGDYATSMGINTTASGNSSTAMGNYSTASGENSVAMGTDAVASGDYSTATGFATMATGLYSTAIGLVSTASGSVSTTIGNALTAPSAYEMAVGRYNTSYTPNSTIGWNAADRLFTISNGTSNTNRSDAIVVLKNGNVGIGTSSPTNLLEVSAGTSGDAVIKIAADTDNSYQYDNPAIYLEQDGGAVGGWITFVGEDDDLSVGTLENAMVIGSENTNSALQFINADTARMTIETYGNVGIGTATPTNLFTVYSTTGGDDHGITIATPRPVLILEDTDANTWKIEMNAKKLQFTEDGVGTAMTIEDVTGEVGIGTTTPGYKLEVNGTAAKTGGGSWTATSDRRLKQNINTYSDGLEALMQIRPVTYHYNEKSGYDTEPEYVGVIAQELQEIAPYMVGNFDKDGVEYLNVDNSAMTYMLINAVKEQQKIIEAQQSRIESLEDENMSNARRLQRLEELMGSIGSKLR